ncbi:LytTR family transcriptional regulator DNA-binding domain-containing protein, partial [Bacteroides hominis]|nr:LytTR family transcriptional regulator DNA-binding domain-containing protein [Bacteroides fragilis]
ISLHDVLEKLPANFLLINRGIIVNIEHVTDLVCLDGVYHVKMDNNKIYRISTRKVAILKRTLMAKSDTIQV